MEILELIHTTLEFPDWVTYGATIGFIIGIVQLIYTMIRVFAFSYYFYIDHGFILVAAESQKEKL